MPHNVDDSDQRSWVSRTHPDYDTWHDDEERMRATVNARVRDLNHYLVPHRFEATRTTLKKPENLDRAQLGYGISLNESYLHEIQGHIRSAQATYSWGPLGAGEPIQNKPPENTTARSLWEDADRENTSWRNFFERDALTWMLSTPGSLIVADVPTGRASPASDDARRRPFVRHVPMSSVRDVGRGANGFRYVKMLEVRDRRSFMDAEPGFTKNVIVYWLRGGETIARRWTMDGEPMHDEINLGRIEDRQGDPSLPVVLNTFGRHPDVSWLGSGLLVGLDDIVIDLFNAVNEMRTSYRDAAIDFLAYFGDEDDAAEILTELKEGSRYLYGGNDENASLERLASSTTEIEAALAQIEFGLKAWANSAKRRASDATDRAQARSGVSLQAEFQLDIAPLLREIAGQLDNIESSVMHRLAQLDDENLSGADLDEIGVHRNREFRPEDEASRISRLVNDFREMLPMVPAEAKSQLVVRWLEANGVNDLDQEVQTADGETVPLRELVERRAEELAEFSERQMRQRASLTGPLVRDTGDEAP